MRTFMTTVKLTNTQAKKLSASIVRDEAHATLEQLFTLPIGTPVTWEWETNPDTNVMVGILRFCRSAKSSATATEVTIRLSENDIEVLPIVGGFLEAKNFGWFKRCVWEFGAHIIGHTIKIDHGAYDQTFAKCDGCGKVKDIEAMTEMNTSAPGKNKKPVPEYLCLECEYSIHVTGESDNDCHIIDVFEG